MYPPLNPILLQLGPISIHWYGLTMTLAIFLAALVASRYLARHNENPNTIWDMLLWILIPAVIGARLYFVLIQAPRGSGPGSLGNYLAHPIKIVQIWNGGIHIYGAFILGGIALLLYLRLNKLPMLVHLDAIGLGLLLGQAIGRIGNFINQELYGPPTTLPWGLRIDPAHRIPPYTDLARYPESIRFHPLFLYELLWDTLGFLLLSWISRRWQKSLRTGDLFLLYLIWAPLGRFFIEFLRTDSWFFPGTPFDTVHILTAIMVIGAAITLFLRHRTQPLTSSQEMALPSEQEQGTISPSEQEENPPADTASAGTMVDDNSTPLLGMEG